MITFAFLLQNFGKLAGATYGNLSFYERRLSGGDTQEVVDTPKPYLL